MPAAQPTDQMVTSAPVLSRQLLLPGVARQGWLMQEFGIAGGIVDKAIDVLRGEGLVRTVTGRGIYVVPPSER